LWAKSSHTLAFLRFFTPNPFSRNQNWTFINVHFWKSQNTFGKSNVCDHNEKLASGDRKKIKNFVTLFFLFFGADSLGVFLCRLFIR
jgi:hypothetical protein